jgi:hypothetical protein
MPNGVIRLKLKSHKRPEYWQPLKAKWDITPAMPLSLE